MQHEFSAIKIIDNNPFPQEVGPPDPGGGSHEGMCFDHSHNVWMDGGSPCQCSECAPEQYSSKPEGQEPTDPTDQECEHLLTVETIKFVPDEPEGNNSGYPKGIPNGSGSLNFMHRQVLAVVASVERDNKPVTVDNIQAYLRQPVPAVLRLLSDLEREGKLIRDDPNTYRRSE